MKKILPAFIVLSLFITGCNEKDKKIGDISIVDSTILIGRDSLGSLPDSIAGLIKMTSDEVLKMSDNYRKAVQSDPIKGILIINLSCPRLMEFARLGEGMSFIMGAEDNGKIVVIMEIYHADDGELEFYDASEIFKDYMTGMRNRPVLCPPPPGCDIP
ncbi:MAG: hypothetical protein WKF88_12430 [Ferruginibacter sp.]